MVLLDFILLTPLVFGLIRGFFNGLVKELVSIIAVIIGIYAAYTYASDLKAILAKYMQQDDTVLSILAYLIILGLVLIAAFALSYLLTKMLQALSLGIINRIMGGLFGFGKSLLILLVIINVISPFITKTQDLQSILSESLVYQKLNQANDALGSLMPTHLTNEERPAKY